MADRKLSASTAITALASDDLLMAVDVSDTTDSASGTNKKITQANFKTDLSIPSVDDTAYNATSWDSNTDAATKNSIRDKVETMSTAIGLNTAKTTNATHTGEVTGSGALTVADNIVDEANMKISNAPTNDHVLTADSAVTGGWKWAASSSGFSDPMTTRGDIIYKNASNVTTRLGLGTDGQALMSDGTDLAWEAPAGGGDVTGPGGAVDDNITVFDSTTGKIIKDSGTNISAVTANSAKVTNATHTGDVTGDTALTIGADKVLDTHINWGTGATEVYAEDVPMLTIGTPTYDNIKDWADTTQSSGIISGGGFTDNTNGTVSVAAGTGFLRANNSATDPILFCDWAINSSLSLTDASVNYILVDYNSGTPTVSATLVKADGNNRNKILLGKIYRDGTDLHMVEAGMVITELARKLLIYLTTMHGEVAYGDGIKISEKATRHFELTTGTLLAGFTPVTFAAYDSSVTNFNYWYNNGSWTSTATGTISNTQYNNYGTGLADLSVNKYGVHWMYVHDDGDVDVVYGIGDYTLTEAEAAGAPANLPDIISNFTTLAGKVIIKKTDATFTEISSAFDTTFIASAATIHSELASLVWADSGHTGNASKIASFDGSGVASEKTVGIADNNVVGIDDTDAVDDDYAKFTANGLEGRSFAEVRTDINVEDGADVTDATNVNAAGATMNTDATLAGNSYFLDEDTLVSDSDTKVASQQSIKAYVDGVVASSVNYQGGYDADTNTPDLDTSPSGISKGDMYTVTVAGTFFTQALEVGDVLISEQADPTTLAHWTIVNKDLDAASIKTSYESNADTNAYTDAEETKVGHLTVTQAVDLDTMESNIATNNAKISFDSSSSTKLGTIEESADVTDTANVTSAGALMDSEVDADIKTLVLPASTTISAFGATVVDDADASAGRTTLVAQKSITFATSAPSSPSTNDLWIDTTA